MIESDLIRLKARINVAISDFCDESLKEGEMLNIEIPQINLSKHTTIRPLVKVSIQLEE